jgi:hypothetical protein
VGEKEDRMKLPFWRNQVGQLKRENIFGTVCIFSLAWSLADVSALAAETVIEFVQQ